MNQQQLPNRRASESLHTSDAGPALKNLSVAYPLQAFEIVRLNTACRNYLVKGLLPNSGLAVIWGPPKCGKSAMYSASSEVVRD